jgi:hypothetical protein
MLIIFTGNIYGGEIMVLQLACKQVVWNKYGTCFFTQSASTQKESLNRQCFFLKENGSYPKIRDNKHE